MSLHYLVFPGVVLFVILGTAVWGVLVDGTFHRPPSDWLVSLYLGLFVAVLSSVAFIADVIFAHLLISAVLGVAIFAGWVYMTVQLWRRVKAWDDLNYAKERAMRVRSKRL